MYFNYVERNENELFLDKESGWFPGLGVRLTKFCGPVFFEGDLGVIRGDGMYDGHLQPSFETFSMNSFHMFVKGDVKLGYLFNIRCYDQLIPYISYGYSWWNRGGDGVAKIDGFGINAVTERYEFQYLLVGLRYQHQFLDCLLAHAGFGIGGALTTISTPSILKTRRFGYDGKGQYVVKNSADAEVAWQAIEQKPAILEQFIEFERELSQVAVRDQQGNIKFYPLAENQHQHGILSQTIAPFNDDELEKQAKNITKKILEHFDYVGVFCVELFQVGSTLMVNEFAPRVHNSGHWTIEGAETSQFENHCRALVGLPLGSIEARGYSAMLNCIGEEPELYQVLSIPGVHYHHYGKAARPKRKLAHTTLHAIDHNDFTKTLPEVKKIIACVVA